MEGLASLKFQVIWDLKSAFITIVFYEQILVFGRVDLRKCGIDRISPRL